MSWDGNKSWGTCDGKMQKSSVESNWVGSGFINKLGQSNVSLTLSRPSLIIVAKLARTLAIKVHKLPSIDQKLGLD